MFQQLRLRWISPVFFLLALMLSACQSTTSGGATGSDRSQLLLISSAEVNAGAEKAYKGEVAKARAANALNTPTNYTRRVNAISKRLIAHVKTFRADAVNWKWEVNVFNSKTVNAYCMPGGKIVVYTGIISELNLTDDELAAVIGHEMAHALREHSREQISQEIAKQQTLKAGSQLLGLGSGTTDMVQLASKYVMTLPFSRTMEHEADVMGMELMARAGYDPQGAVNIWKKMSALGGEKPAELLSTHPSDSNRIDRLQAELPKVMPLYEAAQSGKGKSKGGAKKKKKSKA
ncbi:MAG: M48 family metallopeptidase [Burkholderiaceae bacterium]|jgi:predicted Zn-dependent protease|nr:M48 family metallopeptidase [Burkholderiaceae bacterium]